MQGASLVLETILVVQEFWRAYAYTVRILSYWDACKVFIRMCDLGRQLTVRGPQEACLVDLKMDRQIVAGSNIERLIGWWVDREGIHSNRRAFLVCCLLALCAATFALGVPRLRIFGHDVFFALEGAWRVLNGQRPTVDFYAVKGPVCYLLDAAGLALSHGAAKGLGYTSTIVAIVLSAWTYLVLQRRMEPMPLFLACTGLLLLAVAPFALGERPYQTSFAMTYNRYGYAFTGLILLECFLPPDGNGRRTRMFGDGFSSGLACAILVFLKISFGLVSLVLVGISIVLRRREWTFRIAGLAAGFALFSLPMLAYLRFDLPALIHEYRIVAAVRGSSGVGVAGVLRICYEGRYEIGIVLLLALGITLLPGIALRRSIVLALVAAAVTLADLLLRLTNAQASDLPLIAVVALLLVNEVTVLARRYDARGSTMQLAMLLCLGLGLLSAGMRIGADATGLAGALIDQVIHPKAGYRFKESQLSALAFFDLKDPTGERKVYDNDNGQAYVRYTEEGIDLARANSRPNESVRSMGNETPFSYALLRPPSRGGANDISYTDVSRKLVPPPDMVLGDVDIILIPHYLASERETMNILLSAYKDFLKANYVIAAESANWTLLRKR